MLCDQVPGRPDRQDGTWRIVCPICGRGVEADSESDARRRWELANPRPSPSRSDALALLDAIEDAMCDLEALRTVPGAMTAWSRWMDDLREIRRLVEEAEG